MNLQFFIGFACTFNLDKIQLLVSLDILFFNLTKVWCTCTCNSKVIMSKELLTEIYNLTIFATLDIAIGACIEHLGR